MKRDDKPAELRLYAPEPERRSPAMETLFRAAGYTIVCGKCGESCDDCECGKGTD
jgi:hypothetical protein